jgi:hypothetical protein
MVVAEYQLKLRMEKMEKKNIQIPAQSRWYQFLRKIMSYFFIIMCIVSVEITQAGENLALVCNKKECGEFSYKAIVEPYWPSRIAVCTHDAMPHRLYAGLLFGLYPLLTQTDKPETREIIHLGNIARNTVTLLHHAVVAQLKEKDFIDLLLTEPVMAFNILSCINSLCWCEINSAMDVITGAAKANASDYEYDGRTEVALLKNYFQKYEKLCPVFCCGLPYSMRPPPLRPQHPLCETFHEKIISAVLDKIGTTNKTIHYVTDPMDGLFTDLFILSRVLAQKPNASIAVHILNGKNKEYCIFKDAHQLTRALDTHDTIDWFTRMKRVNTYVKNNNIYHHPDSAVTIGVFFEETELFVKPTLTFLRKSFPLAHIELYLHSDHTDYWNYREEHKLPVADIIYTTHEEFMNRLKQLPDSPTSSTCPDLRHVRLCIKTLQENPAAGCFFVSHNDLDSDATLACRIHPLSTPKAKPLKIPVRLYSDTESIYERSARDCSWFDPNGEMITLFVEVERI